MSNEYASGPFTKFLYTAMRNRYDGGFNERLTRVDVFYTSRNLLKQFDEANMSTNEIKRNCESEIKHLMRVSLKEPCCPVEYFSSFVILECLLHRLSEILNGQRLKDWLLPLQREYNCPELDSLVLDL